MSDTIAGCVERITFYNPQNSFTVAKLTCHGHSDLVCVVGPLPAVQPGESIRCEGTWHTHPQHGHQFLVSSARIETPADVVGIQKYLQSGLVKGIGPVYAQRIVNRFGDKTLDVLDTTPERLREIPGIGTGRLSKIVACWNEQRAIRSVMIFLQSFGVSPAYAQRIFKAWGTQSIAAVKANPYRLAREIRGIGFKTADAIAERMGIAREAPARLEAGIEHTLATLSNEGHVCYPRADLATEAAEVLETTEQQVTPCIDQLLAARRLIEKDGLVWKRALYLSEQQIATELYRLLSAPSSLRSVDGKRALEWVQETLSLRLAHQQEHAVRAALSQKVLVITGGPGTGKSTITRAILTIASKLTRRILLAAPTGRAAKRMTEVTGRHSQTIHALLEWDPQMGLFKKGAGNRLSCDMLIIDEASMIDTVLASNLLKAIPDAARLVLIGDVSQLPSVGPGNVLQDIIESGAVTVASLSEIFRQSRGSQIVVNAHRIQKGEFPYLKQKTWSDFFFLERESPEEVRQTILELVTQRLPKRYALDPVTDIQVLAPMKRGVVGTIALNTALQTALNPKGPALAQFGREYREGDKVMQSKNNYDKKVYNGDIGTISRIDSIDHQVYMCFEGREVSYTASELDEVQLAYAVSIHKSQGSEYPCVVLPIHTTHFKLLHRNLIYTGITRGKRLVILVGTKKALAIAVSNDEVKKRHTNLMTALSKTEQRPLLVHRDQR